MGTTGENFLHNLVRPADTWCLHAGDWAAWGDTQHSVPAVTAPPPDAAAAPPAAQEEDGGWDAFQGGDTGPTAAATAGAPVSSPAPSTDDPFAAWTSAPTAAATPASAAPAAAAAGDKGSSAGLSSAPAVGPKHSQKRSAEDIMKMFDMPQQGLGPQPGQQGQGQGQQQMGLFGGSGVGQPGGMAGMTPQQMMQVSLISGAVMRMLRHSCNFVLTRSLLVPDHPAHHLCLAVMRMAGGHFCMGLLDDCAFLSSAVMLLCMHFCRDRHYWLTVHSLLRCRHSRCMLCRCSRWLPT